jgi:hypothetical protein
MRSDARPEAGFALDPGPLALRLTLLALLLQPVGLGWVRPVLLGLAAAGLAIPRLLGEPLLWLAIAALAAARVLLSWPLGDNHAYLLVYWCLAVALAQWTSEPRRAAAVAARWLIGLAFAFAVAWKALSPDYLDGRFFRVTLLMDGRFEPIARWAGGFDDEELSERRDFLGEHIDGVPAPGAAAPPEPARLRTLAVAATAATFAIELVVALAFLCPARLRLARWRDSLLLAFCATTYAIAPVEGFGWLLLAMGLAQSEPGRARPLAYAVVYGALLLYRHLPWASWLLAAVPDA